MAKPGKYGAAIVGLLFLLVLAVLRHFRTYENNLNNLSDSDISGATKYNVNVDSPVERLMIPVPKMEMREENLGLSKHTNDNDDDKTSILQEISKIEETKSKGQIHFSKQHIGLIKDSEDRGQHQEVLMSPAEVGGENEMQSEEEEEEGEDEEKNDGQQQGTRGKGPENNHPLRAQVELALEDSGCHYLKDTSICSPFVVILGAAKCGTNALQAYLMKYPGFTELSEEAYDKMKATKGWAGEINWKSESYPLFNSSENQLEYSAHFPETDWISSFAIDKSTGYLHSEYAAKDFPKALPRTKFVAVLCNPTKRVWSALNQWYWKLKKDMKSNRRKYLSYYSCPLMLDHFGREALRQFSLIEQRGGYEKFQDICPMHLENFASCSICAYIRNSIYAPAVRTWLHQAGNDRLHIINSDDLKKNPRTVLRKLLKFLNLDASRYPRVKPMEVNSHRDKAFYDADFPLPLQAKLKAFFKPSIDELEKLVHRSFGSWTNESSFFVEKK